jgi:ferredoxin
MIKVDQNKCIGCGLCAGKCPETFQMNLDGKSELINDKNTPCAQEVVRDCPTKAISLSD